MSKLLISSMSGGLDSSTLVAKALDEGYSILPINFNYGQKNIVEMASQKKVRNFYATKYPGMVMDTLVLDINTFLKPVVNTFQKNRDNGKANETTGMEFYFPARNLLFMSVAAVVGEIIANDQSIKEIALGLGIHKHSDIYAKDYWDISPEFADKLQSLLSLNDNVDVKIYAPYKDGEKSKIIDDVVRLDVPYKLTWTCYNPDLFNSIGNSEGIFETYVPCMRCEACLERASQAVKSELFTGGDINDYFITIKKD